MNGVRAIMSNHLLTQHNLMEGRQGIARAHGLVTDELF
jgi:hypothetical protein